MLVDLGFQTQANLPFSKRERERENTIWITVQTTIRIVVQSAIEILNLTMIQIMIQTVIQIESRFNVRVYT